MLSQACCCAAPVGVASGRIMSKYGLITECNVGISPQAGDELGCVMQACGWTQNTICSDGSKLGTTAYPRSPIVISYKLESSEAFSGSGHQPAHWIWYTKNRCLALDPFFPGCNACCCQDGTYYAGFFASTPAPFPFLGTTLQECGNSDAGGRCIDGAFAEDVSACYLDDYGSGEADREFLVGAYDFFFRHYSGQPRSQPLYWWQWNSVYPSATLDEQYEAHAEFANVCNTGPFNRDNQGLSTYQARVAKHLAPDVWEILNFNDGKAIGVMRNNPSAVAVRGRVSYYEQCEYIDASNRPGIAPPYVSLPSSWNAQGGHGLFRYFFGFAAEEFSYVKGETPSTQFLTKNNGANDVLLGKALPSYFHQVADAVPLFSFATEFVQCTGAAGEGEQNLTYAMCEIGAELAQGAYTARQQTALLPNATDLDGWEDQCDAVDSALRQSEMEDMLACKDWREEIWDDLQTLEVFRQTYDLGWSDMTSITASFPTIASLKPVGPVRLRGDWFDLRALTVTQSGSFVGVNTTTRPPALAVCQSDSTGVESEYEDSTDSDKKTLQVAKQIYTMSSAPSGFYRDIVSASTIVSGNQYKIVTVGSTDFTAYGASANGVGVIFVATGSSAPGTGTVRLFDDDAYYAWQRLTQSVYFRSKPIGWDFNAMFQNQVPIGKTARYRWLENRRDAQYPIDITTGGTALVSLGTNASPATNQPQWCTNGTPQDADQNTSGVPCTSVNCDSHGSVVAYSWNSSILVARHCRSKFFDGQVEDVCVGVSDPTALTNGCCKITRMTDASDALVDNPTYRDGTKPRDSNICYVRFVNRPWEWYSGAVPYRMVPTSTNVVDRFPICCEFPHPYEAVCNTNTSMSINRTDDEAAGQGQTAPNQTPCENDPCVQVSAGQSHCYTNGPCANLDLSGSYGIGNYFCGSQSTWRFASPTKGVKYKVGFTGDATATPSTWAEKPPCSEEYPYTAYPEDTLRPFRYPIGHTDQKALAASFVVYEYPGSTSSAIQSTECCSIDDRDDQRRGTEGIQKRHWLSFPEVTITTGP